MAQDNVELLRGTYEAFGRGDVPTVLGSFADDITWHVPAVLPTGGDAKGKEEVAQFFQRLVETWKEGLALDLRDYVASGDRVCVIGRAEGRLDGTQTGYGFVHCWTVRDGLCVDFDEYVDPDQEMLKR